MPCPSEPLFLSGRHAALPIRSTQAVVAAFARRVRLERLGVSAHTLRHTFMLNYLRDNPGKLVELAGLLGHEVLGIAQLVDGHDSRTAAFRPRTRAATMPSLTR